MKNNYLNYTDLKTIDWGDRNYEKPKIYEYIGSNLNEDSVTLFNANRKIDLSFDEFSIQNIAGTIKQLLNDLSNIKELIPEKEINQYANSIYYELISD